MGYKIEHNTLIRLKKEDKIDLSSIKLGYDFIFIRENPRIYPLNIPLLLLTQEWKVLGYAMITKLVHESGKTILNCRVISKFDEEIANQYSKDLMSALKISGYIDS